MSTPCPPDSVGLVEVLHEGEWTRLQRRMFLDREGRAHWWEYVTRKQTAGAVMVLPVIPGNPPEVVLVRQFRPPLGRWVVEFPAGLLGTGESVAECALRELEEETGCRGTIAAVGSEGCTTPGLTDEAVVTVLVEITERGRPSPEAMEHLEVMTIPLPSLRNSLWAMYGQGLAIDAKLWLFAEGLAFTWDRFLRPTESAEVS